LELMSSPTWYCVNAARERLGPMAADEIRRRFETGELQRRSLVWQNGMAQWQPLESVAGELGIALAAETPTAPPAMPDPPPARAASVITAETPRAPAAEAAMAQAYAASSRDASATGTVDDEDIVDAGFLRRFAAFIVDSFVLGIAMYAIIFLMLIVLGFGIGGIATMFESSASGGAPEGPLLWVFVIGFYVLPILMQGAYHIVFTGSAWQATPGKRVLGIKVVDQDGRRITLARSTGRWFAAALSYLTFYIGFLMAAFTDRKLALHDMVASTRVVDQWAYTANPERQQRGLGGCGIAILVGGLLLGLVFFVGILAAVSLPAYQDYTQRAKVAEVVAQGRSMTLAIDEFVLATDRCPSSPPALLCSRPTSARSTPASAASDSRWAAPRPALSMANTCGSRTMARAAGTAAAACRTSSSRPTAGAET
jgi:uncharacterized RDD family membrane protein YckC/type II secretory pathway pseudopilin PulG